MVRQSAAYYADRLRAHGATHRGVDWNSVESQTLRFRQLLRICADEETIALNDYGCGYGALAEFLAADGRAFSYAGYDIVPAMIEAARERHRGSAAVTFTEQRAAMARQPYTVASGVFNVKLGAPADRWWEYVVSVLADLSALSSRGFAFNLLTAYSDPDRQRADLFYAEPEAVMGYCMRHFSRRVAILHDYPLYEFTVLVRQ